MAPRWAQSWADSERGSSTCMPRRSSRECGKIEAESPVVRATGSMASQLDPATDGCPGGRSRLDVRVVGLIVG